MLEKGNAVFFFFFLINRYTVLSHSSAIRYMVYEFLCNLIQDDAVLRLSSDSLFVLDEELFYFVFKILDIFPVISLISNYF